MRFFSKPFSAQDRRREGGEEIGIKKKRTQNKVFESLQNIKRGFFFPTRCVYVYNNTTEIIILKRLKQLLYNWVSDDMTIGRDLFLPRKLTGPEAAVYRIRSDAGISRDLTDFHFSDDASKRPLQQRSAAPSRPVRPSVHGNRHVRRFIYHTHADGSTYMCVYTYTLTMV